MIIRDDKNIPVLATFFTSCIAKDDLFAPNNISKRIEEKRRSDTYYLCSKHLFMGSMFSEGAHLYVANDIENPNVVFRMMFSVVNRLQEVHQANVTSLRDFTSDFKYSHHFMNHGFFKLETPANHLVNINTSTLAQFIDENLTGKGRVHWRKSIAPFLSRYKVEYLKELDETEINEFHSLYLNVNSKSHDINTFALPKSVLAITKDSAYEILKFTHGNEVAAYALCYTSGNCYVPLLLGMHYDYLKEGVYRVTLVKVIERAIDLKMSKINFDFGASFEKTRLGAKAIENLSFIQIKDDFNAKLIGQMKA